MRKYATFDGRASRSEYWWFSLFFGPVTVVTYFVSEIAWFIVTLALVLPYVAVSFRRLHDVGRSGWWYWMPPAVSTMFGDILMWQYGSMAMLLTMLLLVLGSMAIFFYWLVLPGDAEANRFGKPPVPVEG